MQFDPQEFERQQKSLVLRTKISLYGCVGWGLVTLFLMVGLFTGAKDVALMGIILTSTVWVQTEIITRAIASLHILRNWKTMMETVEKLDKPTQTPPSNDEDGK